MAEEIAPIPADDKFIVFKREDWDNEFAAKHEAAKELERLYRVEDAVVLRLQDVFAESVLFHYASSVATTAEILLAFSDGAMKDEYDEMMKVADRFMDLGVAAADRDSKLPD